MMELFKIVIFIKNHWMIVDKQILLFFLPLVERTLHQRKYFKYQKLIESRSRMRVIKIKCIDQWVILNLNSRNWKRNHATINIGTITNGAIQSRDATTFFLSFNFEIRFDFLISLDLSAFTEEFFEWPLLRNRFWSDFSATWKLINVKFWISFERTSTVFCPVIDILLCANYII